MLDPRPAPVPRNVWLLPDDGIIDPIAVEIAATGQRPVRLTAAERREAAARILAEGGSPWLISRRLKMTPEAARSLAASIAESMAPEIKAPEIKAPETKEPERG